ncbi:hypothetical protein LOD99_10978 [Oopsacas minuta]|uniref:Reticulon-like protein n=1 Tax=Oopsacas minuta TaxID=111878 RepID=A0AAV7KDK8_9METZ|nr:hypothetical protein LOD99_10978 [Oopsacas minuta]
MSQDTDFQTRQGMLASVLYPHRRVLVKMWKSLTFEPKSEAFGAALIGLVTILFLTLYVYDLSVISICGIAIIVATGVDFALKKHGWVNALSPRSDTEDKYFAEVVSRELTSLNILAEHTVDFFYSVRIVNPFKFYSMVLITLIILSELTSSVSAWLLLGILSVVVMLIPGFIRLCRNQQIEPSSVLRDAYKSLKMFQLQFQLQVIVCNLVILALAILFRGYGLANLMIGLNILSLIYFLMPSDLKTEDN